MIIDNYCCNYTIILTVNGSHLQTDAAFSQGRQVSCCRYYVKKTSIYIYIYMNVDNKKNHSDDDN